MNLPKILNPSGKISLYLPAGILVELPIYRPTFKEWQGDEVGFDYGKKPIVDYGGEGIFAELALLRIFLSEGWEGVWVETYGGLHFLDSMPKEWKLSGRSISIPESKLKIITDIQKLAKTTACFDVLVWKGDQLLFCEAKRKKKDKLTGGQLKFIESALAYGLPSESLLIAEWDFQDE